MKRINSKIIAFTAVMVALGNALSALSIGLSKVGQVGLDLSHIATLIAAIYGGPLLGFIVGFLGGLVPGIYFGPLGMLQSLGLFGLPIGKSLTGVAVGGLFSLIKASRKKHLSLLTIPAVLVGYIPECLFTVFFFLILVPYFLGWVSILLLTSIIIKAWIEISLMSILMAALVGNNGFDTFMKRFFVIRT